MMRIRMFKLVAIMIIAMTALLVPSQKLAAEASGEMVARCAGLYKHLIVNHRDSDKFQNRDIWSDKLVYWSMLAVERSTEGKDQPSLASAESEVDDIVRGLGNNQMAVQAFLEGGIEFCESEEESAADTSQPVGSSEGSVDGPDYEQAIQCSGLFTLYMSLIEEEKPSLKQHYMSKAENWIYFTAQKFDVPFPKLTDDVEKASDGHKKRLTDIEGDAERIRSLEESEGKCDALGDGFVGDN